jgi:hypothetical protein
LLATIDQALDAVAETIEPTIEWASATFGSLPRDGDPDAMLARILSNPPAAVPFVPNDPARAVFGTTWPTPLHGPAVHELFEDHRLVPLSRGEHEGHQLTTPFGPQVDFGAEPAPAPA